MFSNIKGLWRKFTLRKLELDQDDEKITACTCCGNDTHTVLGFIHQGNSTLAAYRVSWTEGHKKENPPWFIITMGAWGDGTTGKNRATAGCLLIQNSSGQSFQVVDASSIESRSPDIVGHYLTREEVMSGKVKDHLFKLIDKIVFYEPRIKVLFGE
jgi:hypothetical protein